MPDYTDLIARLEAASEGSRELDWAIRDCLGTITMPLSAEANWSWVRRVGDQIIDIGPESFRLLTTNDTYLPRYTTSVDAALTLVPEGFAVREWTIWPGMPSTLVIEEAHKEADGKYWRKSGYGRWPAEGKTPALALCIAALRARQAIEREGR